MVFEDLHWIDPSSRELLDRIIERIARLPVLLVATFRPEFAPPWSGLPQVTALTLARLDGRTGAAMVECIVGNAALSPKTVAEIVERADGIPLFVEELTKAVLEASGGGEGVERTLSGAASPSATVPAALHASLMVRLDRLGQTAKEIAQIASAIGREFSYELLGPGTERSEVERQDALDRLADAGLVFLRGAPPHATYLFKHALVRDAAYDSLLRRRREALHARIAAVLEADFPDRMVAEPELFARHLTEAGLLEKAVAWWQRAGERATERSANLEAIAHLKRGIEILMRLPESQKRDEQELLVQAALMGPLMANEGYASGTVEQAARRAVALGGRIDADPPAQIQTTVRARSALAAVHMHRGELRTGLAIADETLGFAERLGSPLGLSRAHYLIGMLDCHLGNLAAARRHLERATLYDYDRDHTNTVLFGVEDIRVGCHGYLSSILWQQGLPDEALRHAEEAIAEARVAASPFTEAFALHWAATLHQLRGEAALCLERAEAVLAVATEQAFPLVAAYAIGHSGWALVKGGRAAEGLARLRSGIDAYRRTPARLARPLLLARFADACLVAGCIEEGLSAVRDALTETEETEVRWYDAELNRLEGELLLASERPDESRAFQKALDIARGQQAKSWELRAATSLARLLARQGRREEARALLAPIYGWFTEGFDTADLIAAKALLGELT
jgi:tetratricopeptide (TPR) repeat protein